MSKLTDNIWRHELACNCGCGFDSMDWETINAVQDAADHFSEEMGKKCVVVINSAARCYEYNRKPVIQGGPGSNDNSQHPRARAIDFFIIGVSMEDLYDYLDKKYPSKYGIGKYTTFVHIDSRGYRARW